MKSSLSSLLAYFHPKPLPYGAGTLMMVFTSVVDAFSAMALPFSVTKATLPAVENDIPALEMMVPSMVPPPAPLIVAALPTYQKMFLDWAPLPGFRIMLRGAPGAPTVSELAIWKTQTAFASPPASSVRSAPCMEYVPGADL